MPNYIICLVSGTEHCKVSTGITSSAARAYHQFHQPSSM